MTERHIGDAMMIKKDFHRTGTNVHLKREETGRILSHKVEKTIHIDPDDLKLTSPLKKVMGSNGEWTKTVIVTGGAGYVGSVLVRTLLQKGYRVVCIDNLRYGGSALAGVWGEENFSFIKADVTDSDRIDEILDHTRCRAIVHLAAIVGDPACQLEPELARRTNLDASLHLMESAIRSGIPRFIFASTCSNYGKMKESGIFVDETSPLAPVSLYAELKVEFEDILLNRIEKSNAFSPTSLRFATVYGISPRMRFDLTVNEFTKELALGRELVVFGEHFWRPYCHVGDFSKAILLVLRAPKEKIAYNVFNVGDTSQNYTKQMIVNELLKQIPQSRVKYVQQKEDPRDYRVRFDKIRDELGFKISKTVPQGIQEVLSAIRAGIIGNPEDQRYYNTPMSR